MPGRSRADSGSRRWTDSARAYGHSSCSTPVAGTRRSRLRRRSLPSPRPAHPTINRAECRAQGVPFGSGGATRRAPWRTSVQAEAFVREAGDPQVVVPVLASVAAGYGQLGRLDEARRDAGEMLPVAREHLSEAVVLGYDAFAATDLGLEQELREIADMMPPSAGSSSSSSGSNGDSRKGSSSSTRWGSQLPPPSLACSSRRR